MRLHFLRYVALGLLVRLLLGAAPANAQAPSFGTVLTVGAGSTGTVQVGKMTSDAQGNRYFAGSFRGTVTFGSTTLSSPNTSDIFVAKLNGAGAYQWVVQAGGADNDSGGSVAVDATGSVYVTGTYIGPATFGLLAVASVTPVPFGYTDAFVARLDGTGNWLWVRTGGGNRSDGAGPVVLDASGNAYVGLFFGGATAQFGPFSVANADGPTSTTSDVVIAKLDPAGTWRWARSAGSGGYDWVSRLALDDAGHLFAALHLENPFARESRHRFLEALAAVDHSLEAPTHEPDELADARLTIPDLGARSPELREARDLIDELDQELVTLLARRAELARRAARAKAGLGEGILDPTREARLVRERRRWATELGLDPESVSQIFHAILRFSRRLQSEGDPAPEESPTSASSKETEKAP